MNLDLPNVAVASAIRRVRWQGGEPKAGRQARRVLDNAASVPGWWRAAGEGSGDRG